MAGGAQPASVYGASGSGSPAPLPSSSASTTRVRGGARAGIPTLARKESTTGHTLQPTALVHEAYVRLVRGKEMRFEDRTHFLAVAARAMRQVLVDHARGRGAAKRGQDPQRVTLDDRHGLVARDPAFDAMGFHLINDALHTDPETDPLRPDLLVYEPADSPDGRARLVALEYEVFRADWYGVGHTEPPMLLGHEFETLDFDGLELFGPHVWPWRQNPLGMFEDFNPKVRCP